MVTAIGSSEALRMVPKLPPILGIPILNKVGGISEPKTPVRRPYIHRPLVSPSFIRNAGGKKINIINEAPVVIIALL